MCFVEPEDENVPPIEKSVAQVTPLATADQFVDEGGTTPIDLPDERDTPEGGEGEKISPNLTGTAMKNTSKDPTPQFQNTKKRYVLRLELQSTSS